MAAGRKPRRPTADEIVSLTGMMYDELAELQEAFDNLDVVDAANRNGQWYTRLPAELANKLGQLLDRLQRPPSRAEIRRQRWWWVRRGFDSLRESDDEIGRAS